MVKSSFCKIFFVCLLLCFAGKLSGEPYKSNVIVSYYGEDFHGKRTSNGEIFNMNDFTCAHKSLPFDTILKITNRTNGKSVEVRVNDRGPFVYDREVDLSKAAAIKLNMIDAGTVFADIEIVKMGPDTKLSRDTAGKVDSIMKKRGETGPKNRVKHGSVVKSSDVEKYVSGTLWDIQVGSFSSRENANKVAQDLLKKGFGNVVFQKNSEIIRVVLRKVPGEKVLETADLLAKKGYEDIFIRERLK